MLQGYIQERDNIMTASYRLYDLDDSDGDMDLAITIGLVYDDEHEEMKAYVYCDGKMYDVTDALYDVGMLGMDDNLSRVRYRVDAMVKYVAMYIAYD